MVLAAVIVVTASCSTATPPPSPAVTVADLELTAPVALTFWHAFGADPQKKALEDLVADFNRTNGKGITVTTLNLGSYSQLYQRSLGAITTGTQPELIHAYETFVADYMKADAVVDLGPYIGSAKNGLTKASRDDIFKGFYDTNTFAQFGGRLLSFPLSTSLFVLYQNDDLLKASNVTAPKTWAEFERAVQTLTRKDAAGQTTTYGWAIPLDASNFSAWVSSMGGALMAADNRTVAWNGKEGLEVLRMIDRLIRGGYAYVPKGFDFQSDFAASRLPFFMGSTSTRPFIATAIRTPLNWSIQQVPQTSPVQARTIQYGANVAILKSTPEKQLAAWLFVKWFSERDQTARWATQSYFLPVRKSAADAQVIKDFWSKSDPQGKQAFGLLGTGVPEPNVRGQQEIRDAVLDALTKVALGTETPENALKVAGERANAILKDN